MANTLSRSIKAHVLRGEERKNADEQARRDECAKVSASLPRLADAAVSAAACPGQIEEGWLNGQDIPPIDYAVATAEAIKTERILSGAKAKVAELAKSLSAGDSLVASELVAVFASLLPGVTVVATDAQPSYWDDAHDGLAPYLVLVQETESTRDSHMGSLSAKLTAYYRRSKAHKGIGVMELERAADAARIALKVIANRPSSSGDDYVTDRLQIDVSSVYDGTPVIGSVEGFMANGVPVGAANAILNGVGAGTMPMPEKHGNGIKVSARNGSVDILGIEVAPVVDGSDRTVTLRANLSFVSLSSSAPMGNTFGDSPSAGMSAFRALEDHAERMIGVPVAGVGRCETFKVYRRDSTMATGPNWYAYAIEATFSSRTN